MSSQIDIAVAISLVSSWMLAVSDRNREALLNTVGGWEQIHSDMLITEIDRKLTGNSVLATGSWEGVSDERIAKSLTALSSTDVPPPLAALFAGLLLVD